MFVGRLAVLSFSLPVCVSAFSLVTSRGTEEGFPLPTSCRALREKTHQQVSYRHTRREKCSDIKLNIEQIKACFSPNYPPEEWISVFWSVLMLQSMKMHTLLCVTRVELLSVIMKAKAFIGSHHQLVHCLSVHERLLLVCHKRLLPVSPWISFFGGKGSIWHFSFWHLKQKSFKNWPDGWMETCWLTESVGQSEEHSSEDSERSADKAEVKTEWTGSPHPQNRGNKTRGGGWTHT